MQNLVKMFSVLLFFIISISLSFGQENDTFNKINHEQNVKNYSLQIVPLPLWMFKSDGSYIIGIDLDFQMAINDYFNISIIPLFSFYKNISPEYDADQINFLVKSGVLFRPFKTRLKGMYIGAYFPLG